MQTRTSSAPSHGIYLLATTGFMSSPLAALCLNRLLSHGCGGLDLRLSGLMAAICESQRKRGSMNTAGVYRTLRGRLVVLAVILAIAGAIS